VGGGGFLVKRGSRGTRVRPVYLRIGCAFVGYSVEAMGVGYGGVGCKIETMCDWGRDPRFALEYFELFGAWLFPDVAWLTSPAGWAGC
jgi:hypothetical protein